MKDQANEPEFDASSIGKPVEAGNFTEEPNNKDTSSSSLTPARPKRRRIPREQRGEAVEDPMEYKSNLCTESARFVGNFPHNLEVQLHGDQHYFGHDYAEGGNREGIDIDVVKPLVLASLKHLFFFSSIIGDFSFLNDTHNSSGQRKRVVVQEIIEGGMLNVAIEAHLKEIGVLEVTIKTAMVVEGFNLRDGQYAIEILGDNASILKRLERGSLKDIYSIG